MNDHSIKINGEGKKYYMETTFWYYVKKLEEISRRYKKSGKKHADEVKALNETIEALRAELEIAK